MFRVKLVPNDGLHTTGESGLVVEGQGYWQYPTPLVKEQPKRVNHEYYCS